jgi:predicted acetyltransferase
MPSALHVNCKKWVTFWVAEGVENYCIPFTGTSVGIIHTTDFKNYKTFFKNAISDIFILIFNF